MKRTIIVLAAVSVASGCVSSHSVNAAAEARKAYEAFIGQGRTYHAVVVRGDNMNITLTGVTEIAMDAPLNPLSAMPHENDTPARIADAAKNAILGVAGIAAMREVATRPPTVVHQQAPLVVRPEVITVP